MKTARHFINTSLIIFSLCSPALAAPEFLSYESRNSVRDGQGGERKTLDGVDFWLRGDPPRRYQVIGSLTDVRHKTGLFGAIRMSSLESDIAKAAKAAGGDAVILSESQDEAIGVIGTRFGSVDGSYGNGNFNASGASVGVGRTIKEHNSRFWVIRYLPEPSLPEAALPPKG